MTYEIKNIPDGWTLEHAQKFQACAYYSIMKDAGRYREDNQQVLGTGIKIKADVDHPQFPGQAGVVVFDDDSLYVWSNGGSEAWAFATDFIAEFEDVDPELCALIQEAR